MLAISEQAATVIDGIMTTRELPEEAGIRLSLETDDANGVDARPGIRLDVVEAPESGDQVLDAAPVFLEPEAAEVLDDKLLDADIDGDRVRFAVKRQA